MMPISTPWVSIDVSLRCRPRHIRFVTKYAPMGTTKTATREIQVIVYSGTSNRLASTSLAPSAHRMP